MQHAAVHSANARHAAVILFMVVTIDRDAIHRSDAAPRGLDGDQRKPVAGRADDGKRRFYPQIAQ